jgi:TonB family protein
MKTILTTLFLLFCTQFAFTQQDTIVYYKKHSPIATSEGADQQIVIQRNNKMSSIMMTCSWKDSKWKVDKTEIIKLKKNGRYHMSDGTSHCERSFKKIKDGYEVQEFNHEGKLTYKGLSRSMFPLHRVGQWQNLLDNNVVGINVYNEETITKSYIIANNKHLPTNTYANADSLAIYKDREEGYSKDLARNIEYPRVCQENGISGRVLILFAVDENGSPSDFQILSETNQYFNQAAIAAVQACDKWKPAVQDNKAVKVYSIVPVNFSLR